MSARTFEPTAWVEHHKGGDNLVWQETRLPCTPLYSRAALLADAPDVEGLIERLDFEDGIATFSGFQPVIDLLADLRTTLLAQQARIRELEGEIAKLKGHAEAMAVALKQALEDWVDEDAVCYPQFVEILAAYRRDYPEEES